MVFEDHAWGWAPGHTYKHANRPVAIACPSNGIAHNAGAEFNPPVEPDFDILPNANNGIRKREDAMNRPLWEAITWRK